MKNPYQIIHIIGAVQGVFLFLLLIMRKENKTANKILAFLILLVSINLTTSFFHDNNDAIMDLPAIHRSDIFIYLYGPLLASYTMFLTGSRKKLSVGQGLKLLPGFILLLLFLANRYGNELSVLRGIWDETNPVALRLWFVVHFTALLHLMLYLAYSLRLVHRYDTKLRTFFSNTGRIYLHWLSVLLSSIIFICFAATVQFLIYNFGNTEGPIQWVISATTVVLVFVIGFYTNKQPDILKDLEFIDGTIRLANRPEIQDATLVQETQDDAMIQEAQDTTLIQETQDGALIQEARDAALIQETQDATMIQETQDNAMIQETQDTAWTSPQATINGSDAANDPAAPAGTAVRTQKAKYERNRLSEEDEKNCLVNLIDFVEKNKSYLDPDLDLRQLSEMSGIPSHMISMLLSIHLDRSFYTFINGYRVDEAKRLLSLNSSRESNILTIAYDSGFNSKSTFNMVFRKLEGMTPSEFRAKFSSNPPESYNNFV